MIKIRPAYNTNSIHIYTSNWTLTALLWYFWMKQQSSPLD